MVISWSNITYSIGWEGVPTVRVASNMDTVAVIRSGVFAALIRGKSGEYVYVEQRPERLKIEVGEVVRKA
jgi:hypothetical protein